MGQPARQHSWAYAVPLDGPPRRLPYGPVADLSLGGLVGGDLTSNGGDSADGGTAGEALLGGAALVLASAPWPSGRRC